MQRFRSAVAVSITVVCIAALLLTGCAIAPRGDGTQSASGQMGSRELSATAVGARDFSLEVNSLTDSGTVVINRHKVVVQGDSVLFDGKPVMKLAPGARKVEVAYEKGRFTISDGTNREVVRPR